MTTPDALALGRDAFERQAWAEGYAQLSAADRDAALEPEDLERLATAAYLLGKDTESSDIWPAHIASSSAGATWSEPSDAPSGWPSDS
jgi:hypothetical protein